MCGCVWGVGLCVGGRVCVCVPVKSDFHSLYFYRALSFLRSLSFVSCDLEQNRFA